MKYFVLYFVFIFHHASIACEKTVMIGVNKAWPPYVTIERERYSGLDIEIIALIFRKVGLCPEYRDFASSERALIELQKGTVHMLKAASYTHQRAQIATFTQPYRNEKLILFGNSHSLRKGVELERLFTLNHSFALSRGAYYGEVFSTQAQQYPNQVRRVSTATQRFGLVEKERVSYTIEDELTGHYFLNNKNLGNVFASDLVIHSNPVHFLFNRTFLSQDELSELNLAIASSKEEIDILLNTYLNALSEEPAGEH